jgi:hypothetical protein
MDIEEVPTGFVFEVKEIPVGDVPRRPGKNGMYAPIIERALKLTNVNALKVGFPNKKAAENAKARVDHHLKNRSDAKYKMIVIEEDGGKAHLFVHRAAEKKAAG